MEGGVCGDNVLRKYKEARILCEPYCLKCFHITCHLLKCEVQIRLNLQFSPILSVSWETKYSHRRDSSEIRKKESIILQGGVVMEKREGKKERGREE